METDLEFEQFVLAAWPRLRRAAYLLSHDTDEADDLVQTALAATYARWRTVRKDDAYAYVRRAVVNAYLDSLRRRRPVPVERDPDRSVPADSTVDERSELTELLAPLSPRERTIIVWRYYLDTPEAEVADRLGVSTGTVKSTASRALARVRAAASGHATPTEGEVR
ncbi:SigE family RNA polymerase sigma factor [Nocardioides pantholopis]|uniref:SigE family RNA polymerase sigma factor n=1 Tax=Nocardioides pantholopis TaxID=2483798 RepID=UPI000FDCB39A|nr:SigE family RNA polymerase sigma factor [Nocardioides pantholopis]